MISKRLFSIVSMFTAIAFSIFTVSSSAIAQGRYATVYSRSQVSDIIRSAEDSSDRFRTDFRNQMNQNYGLSNSQKNQYNNNVAQCEEALDRLRDHFNKNNSWWESRSQVQDVVSASQNVNIMMNALPFRRNLESQWNQLRNGINKLADTYDLPGLNGGGWNGGGGGRPGGGGGPGGWPGGNTSQPPSWAVGTFYSTNSNDNIQLTIGENGRISVINNGQSFWGRFYNNQIFLNNDASTVSKWGNGIRTYNRNTGATTNYTRNGGVVGPGPGPGFPGGGNASNPPSWAQGTFYSTNNGQIYLTINGNGRVTVVNGGQSYYGTYYNGILTVNGDSSTVTQNGNNGIRTYNQNTGQTTNYRRR